MLVVLYYEGEVYCAQNMLERARQRRAALEARLSNSDLSTPLKPSGETNHGLACIIFVIYLVKLVLLLFFWSVIGFV